MTITVTWHGHACLSMAVNGTNLLFDPFLNDNPSAKIGADEVTPDYILLTHGHGDHVGDTLSIARRSGATIIANFEICNWFGQQGYEKTHAQHIGGGFEHPFGRVKFTIAFHGSGLPDGSYGGNPCGFLLEADGKRIYVAGDTAVFSDMSLIGRNGLDLAILPIGDNYTMGPEDALLALEFLKPKVVIPYHYNTWPLIEVDVNHWAREAEERMGTKLVVLDVEESYSL